jgi:competence ComEA-like helix-hairpin-helix protein
MATQGERRALMFLVAVALLGAGTRACRAKRAPVANGELAGQIDAVDSARILGSADRRIGRSSKPRRARSSEASGDPPIRPSASRIDLDTAPAEEIERLPGIGPGLARRIVDDRDANGPFGCLAALDRVRGIGPALLARLDSLAAFSQAGRPGCISGGEAPPASPARRPAR